MAPPTKIFVEKMLSRPASSVALGARKYLATEHYIRVDFCHRLLPIDRAKLFRDLSFIFILFLKLIGLRFID